MKKLLTVLTVVAGMTTAAIAADLPKTSVPLPPERYDASLPFFVGINAGGLNNSEDYTLGLTAGSNLNDHFAVEVAYDHIHDFDANQVTGNLIAQTQVGSLTPYVLGGVGYRWANDDESVWNLGAGAKVALTQNIDFDVRYRHVVGFDTERTDDIVTGGLVVKF